MRLFLLLTLLLPLTVLAQYLPLELESTVQLLDTSQIWDVWPLESGQFMWAQAAARPDSICELLWGIVGGAALDSMPGDSGVPTHVTGYIDSTGEPSIVLGTVLTQGTADVTSTGFIRVYHLNSSLPDSVVWRLPDEHYHYEHPADPGTHSDASSTFRALSAAAPLPPPPNRSNRVIAAISSRYESQSAYQGGGSVGGSGYGGSNFECILDVLAGSVSPHLDAFPASTPGGITTWALTGDTLLWSTACLTASATYGSEGGGHQSYSRGQAVYIRWCGVDSVVATADYCVGCDQSSGPPPAEGALPSTLALTNDQTDWPIVATQDGDTLLVIPSGDTPSWEAVRRHTYLFACEQVAMWPGEELLAYDPVLRRFDLYAFRGGQYLGVTDTLPANSSRIVVITRYDSTYRRLAVQSGSTLYLYRFGQYLAADEPSKQVSAAFALYPAFPNPFNASTEIRFELSHPTHVKLTVFDLTGREVAALIDGPLQAGRHARVFDGSNLSSGLYFYRLQTEHQSRTGKLVLLK
jgi:hypothetical protein